MANWKALKQNRNRLSVCAWWLTSIVGTFVCPPPVDTDGDHNTVAWLGRFAVSVLAAFLARAAWKWDSPRHTRAWVIATVVLFIIATPTLLFSLHLWSTYTATYDGQAYLIGDEFTSGAENDCRRIFSLPCEKVSPEDLIWEYGGEISRIWTHDSIRRGGQRVAWLYIIFLLVSAACLICLFQAIYCARPLRPQVGEASVPTPPGQGAPMQKVKILFLAANPAGTSQLALDKEAREIEAKIRASEHRDSLELITKWAVRPDDLLQYLNQHQPHIVHFTGHGSASEEIILNDEQDQPKRVSKDALEALFRTLKDNIRVVLLNSCFSRPQADVIVGQIECAIGMTRAIGDQAAITFAAAFYRAVGFGRSVQQAFEQGRAALLLEGIPEENTPDLLVREGADASQIVLVRPQ